MPKGYQLVELSELRRLVASPKSEHAAVLILDWLVSRLKIELSTKFERAEIEVIPSYYEGYYPAIGIHYLDADPVDLSHELESAASRILSQTSIIDFIDKVAELPVSTGDRIAELKERGRPKSK